MSEETSNNGGSYGCLGPIVAVFLSVKTWGFTWWAVLHFFLGWIYVFYWVIFVSGWIAPLPKIG